MSYAIDKNGSFRAINSIEDLLDGETYSEAMPPIPPAVFQTQVSPIDKLKAFLLENPDVAELLK